METETQAESLGGKPMKILVLALVWGFRRVWPWPRKVPIWRSSTGSSRKRPTLLQDLEPWTRAPEHNLRTTLE